MLQDCYNRHLAHFQYTSLSRLRKKFFHSTLLYTPITDCTSLQHLAVTRLIQYWLVFSADCLFPYVCLYNTTVLCQCVSTCPCLSWSLFWSMHFPVSFPLTVRTMACRSIGHCVSYS